MSKNIILLLLIFCTLVGCTYREVSPGRYWINSHTPFRRQLNTDEEKFAAINKKAAKLCGSRGYILEGKPKFTIGTSYVYLPGHTTASAIPDYYYTQYAQCGD